MSTRSRLIAEQCVIAFVLAFGLVQEWRGRGVELRIFGLIALLFSPAMHRFLAVTGRVAPASVVATTLEFLSLTAVFLYPIPFWGPALAASATLVALGDRADADVPTTMPERMLTLLGVMGSFWPLLFVDRDAALAWAIYGLLLIGGDVLANARRSSVSASPRILAIASLVGGGAALCHSIVLDRSWDPGAFVPHIGVWIAIIPAGLVFRALCVRLTEAPLARVRLVVAFLLITTVFFADLPLTIFLRRNALRVECEAVVKNGRAISLYVNDVPFPMQKPVGHEAKQGVYVFDGLPAALTMLSFRFDPSDERSVQVQVSRISVFHSHELVREFRAAELRSWVRMNVELEPQPERTVDPGQTVRGGAALHAQLTPVLAPPGVGPFAPLIASLATSTTGFAFYVGLLGVLLWLLAEDRSCSMVLLPRLTLMIAFFGWTAGLVLLRSRFRYAGFGSPPSISSAVGQAAFLGYPKSLELVIFGTSVVVALVAGVVWARRWPGEALVQPVPLVGHSPRRFGALLVALILLMRWPDLRGTLEQLGRQQHEATYDLMNLVTWEYLPLRGLLPFRDYWFPYSSFYNELGPFPWDVLRAYLQASGMWIVLALSIYVTTDWSRTRTLAILAILGLAVEAWILHLMQRYGLAVATVMSFVALRRLERANALFSLGWGLYLISVLCYEPVQLAYCVPAVVLLAMLAWSRGDAMEWSRTLASLKIGGAVLTVGLAAHITLLWNRGQLDGAIGFYRDMAGLAAYVTTPSQMALWYCLEPGSGLARFANILLLGVLTLVGYGTYLTARRDRTTVAEVTLGLGVLGVAMLSKQIARQYMTAQLLVIPGLGLLIIGAKWSHRWHLRQWVVIAAFTLRTAVHLIESGTGVRLLEQNLVAPTRIPDSVRVLASTPDHYSKPFEPYFSPVAFVSSSALNAEAIATVLDLKQQSSGSKIFVLGDDCYLYIINDQPPPYYQTLYNSSTIRAQNTVTDWLDREKPGTVIWRSSFESFDLVPHLVRVPLIFEHVIANYVPARELPGGFQVLRRRAHGEPVSWAFWLQHLGGTVDLGCLPGLSAANEPPEADGDGPGDDVLTMTILAPPPEGMVRLKLISDNGELQVVFRTIPRQERYMINLDRIWLWSIAKREGEKPRVVSSWGFSLSPRLRDPLRLY